MIDEPFFFASDDLSQGIGLALSLDVVFIGLIQQY